MFFITLHYRQHPTYVDDASSAVGRAIPPNATTAASNLLGETLNFIDC